MTICLEGERPAGAAAEAPFRACEFRIKWAAGGWEREQAMALRRAVFCAEQGVFDSDDRDAFDDRARLLVACSTVAGMPDEVVGTVRIHEAEPGLWWGSRLAVQAAFRHHGRIGATLIRLAVASAHARGCRLFLAHVQAQNGPLFERLHWHTLRDETLHGRPHRLMQADLAHYPPCHDPYSGFVTRSASAQAGSRPGLDGIADRPMAAATVAAWSARPPTATAVAALPAGSTAS